jgi:hypothetical protein
MQSAVFAEGGLRWSGIRFDPGFDLSSMNDCVRRSIRGSFEGRKVGGRSMNRQETRDERLGAFGVAGFWSENQTLP